MATVGACSGKIHFSHFWTPTASCECVAHALETLTESDPEATTVSIDGVEGMGTSSFQFCPHVLVVTQDDGPLFCLPEPVHDPFRAVAPTVPTSSNPLVSYLTCSNEIFQLWDPDADSVSRGHTTLSSSDVVINPPTDTSSVALEEPGLTHGNASSFNSRSFCMMAPLQSNQALTPVMGEDKGQGSERSNFSTTDPTVGGIATILQQQTASPAKRFFGETNGGMRGGCDGSGPICSGESGTVNAH